MGGFEKARWKGNWKRAEESLKRARKGKRTIICWRLILCEGIWSGNDDERSHRATSVLHYLLLSKQFTFFDTYISPWHYDKVIITKVAALPVCADLPEAARSGVLQSRFSARDSQHTALIVPYITHLLIKLRVKRIAVLLTVKRQPAT